MTCRLGRVHGRLISACAAGDLLDPISDDVTYQLVRQLGRLTGFVADRYRTACSSSPEAWSTPIAGYGEPKVRAAACGPAIWELPEGDFENIEVIHHRPALDTGGTDPEC